MSDGAALQALVEDAALELVLKHSLDEIEKALVSRGVTPEDAERLVLLIPSAFAREHFEPNGIEFPSHFLVGPAGRCTERSYDAEPFHGAARELASRWIAEGRLSLVMRVLDWSAEANGIKEAKAKGLMPTRPSAVHHGFTA
ncbi:MAG: hypothetical protein U0V87_18240 [Acidobacteriota bacterium]